MQVSMSLVVRSGDVGCKRTTQSCGDCARWNLRTSSHLASSVHKASGLLMSVESIMLSINLEPWAASIDHRKSGLPLKSLKFLLGQRFDPFLAGITANTVWPLITPRLSKLFLAGLHFLFRIPKSCFDLDQSKLQSL